MYFIATFADIDNSFKIYINNLKINRCQLTHTLQEGLLV
jgi:hypothetical protein